MRTFRGQKRGQVRKMTETTTQTDKEAPSESSRTIAQICADAGIDVGSVQKACRRANLSVPFDKSKPPTDEQIAASIGLQKALGMVGAGKAKEQPREAPAKGVEVAPKAKAGSVPEHKSRPKPELKIEWRTAVLFCILAATMLVSWQNMFSVTGELFQENKAASLTLTGVLCLSPFAFWLSGMAKGQVKVLVICLGIFEWFCNVARIYGGLTNFDNPNPAHAGAPTRFLGMVCDLLGSGTYLTAKGLAVVLSGLIFWLFYNALFGLKK